MLPHEIDRIETRGKAVRAVLIATLLAGIFAFALALLNFPLNVVVPSTAPVWAGLGSLLK